MSTTTRHRDGSPSTAPRDRRRRWLLKVAGWTLIWLGALVFGYVAYQLWGTGLQTSAAQEQLAQQLTERMSVDPTPSVTMPPADTTTAPIDDPEPADPVLIPEAPPGEGEALGRIRIPAAQVDHVTVSGVSSEALKRGPGHMPWTPLPGQPGNTVISGHRTTYGAPFFYLDKLDVGAEIYVDTLIGTHTYQVREILVVEPTDVWVTDPRPGAWLTLTTCTPRYSAAQRLVIVAEMVDGPNLAVIESSAVRQVDAAS